MFERQSLTTRIAIGKGLGLVVGLLGFFLIPFFLPDADWLIRTGFLLWYITFGAIIGLAGVLTRYPFFKFRYPWWLRDTGFGAWLNFVLAFFAYDKIEAAMVATFGADGLLQSPFWIAGEGAIVGFVIGYFATRYGGEGKEIAGR